MSIEYKGYTITAAVYDRPAGMPFMPRAVLSYDTGDEIREKPLDWDLECRSKAEAERRAIEMARQAIDDGHWTPLVLAGGPPTSRS